MKGTLTEKLLRRGATGVTFEGSEWFEVEPDLVLGHDATIALVVDRFANAGRPLAHPDRLFLVADHFAPPSTVDRANILRRFLDFAWCECGVLPGFVGFCRVQFSPSGFVLGWPLGYSVVISVYKSSYNMVISWL